MSPSFQQNTHRNSAQCCQVQGCGYFRLGLNRWCRQHLPKGRLYGHPLAGPLSPSLWKTQRKEVCAFLAKNAQHRGLQWAVQYLRSWMTMAAADESAFKGAREVAQLVRHGVSPLEVLTELCAHWLWVSDFGHRFPSDKAQDFAISRAIIGLAPRPRRATMGPGSCGTWGRPTDTAQSWSVKPRESALAYVGAHLRSYLAPFLAAAVSGIEEQRKVTEDPQALMRAPFPVAGLTAPAHR